MHYHYDANGYECILWLRTRSKDTVKSQHGLKADNQFGKLLALESHDDIDGYVVEVGKGQCLDRMIHSKRKLYLTLLHFFLTTSQK